MKTRHSTQLKKSFSDSSYEIYDDSQNNQLSKIISQMRNINAKVNKRKELLRDRVINVVSRIKNTNFQIVRNDNNTNISPTSPTDVLSDECDQKTTDTEKENPKKKSEADSTDNCPDTNEKKKPKRFSNLKIKSKKSKPKSVKIIDNPVDHESKKTKFRQNRSLPILTKKPFDLLKSRSRANTADTEISPTENENLSSTNSVANLEKLYDELDQLDDYFEFYQAEIEEDIDNDIFGKIGFSLVKIQK